ncbi:carboxymuconolactone decarboxylase family protein [Brachybacterium sp. AOP43-C2-M15]|uniref:carboxymuconolactone decarboxylase family protein n=1 Tax=Brachybacterium sp. AOP43-C2-M15 TaxID=3457661 RepID=UPI004034F16A
MRDPLPFLDRSSPEAWSMLGEVQRTIAEAARAAGVAEAALELMNLRISQLNGCAFCVHLHHRRAVREGAPEEQVAQLPVWRDSPWFDETERAALLLGETITILPDPMVRDRDLMAVRHVLGEDAFAALEWSAVLMNTYNRLSVLSHHPVPGSR